MDNTVLDKQAVYNDLDNRIERVKSKEAHDEILRLKRLIVSGQFNIPNPLQEENESLKRVLQDIATHVGDITSTQFYQDAYYEVKRIAHKYLQSFPKTEPNPLQQHVETLKQALERARSTMEDALSVGEAYYRDFDVKFCPWADLDNGVKEINEALSLTPTTDDITPKNIQYENIKVGDTVNCNVMHSGKIVEVEHTVTKIDGLDMYGVRHDINKEVTILGASILSHKVGGVVIE